MKTTSLTQFLIEEKRANGIINADLRLLQDLSGAILMERRPPTGIWGGLWCPPMLDEAEDWLAWLLSRYPQAGISALRALPAVDHAFSHFDLQMLPLHIPVAATLSVRDSDSQSWIKMQSGVGCPAPAQKLLQSFDPIIFGE